MTRLPPALVETLPPIAQEPREPRSSGKNMPAFVGRFLEWFRATSRRAPSWSRSPDRFPRCRPCVRARSRPSRPPAPRRGTDRSVHPVARNKVPPFGRREPRRYAGGIDRPHDGERRLRQARAPVVAIARRDVVAEQNGLGAKLPLQLAERFPGLRRVSWRACGFPFLRDITAPWTRKWCSAQNPS